MDDGITDLVLIGFALQQIEQTVLAYIPFIVQVHHKPRIQVTVIPKLIIKIFLNKMKILKNFIVRHSSLA